MTVILDPQLRALMAQDQTGAVLWQDADQSQTALLAKAADADVASFRGQMPISLKWDFGYYPTASILRLTVSLYDRPHRPYRFETFINVGEGEQLACISQLAQQDDLCLHFFDSQTDYVFSKTTRQTLELQHLLSEFVAEAEADYAHLADKWDFAQAKARFQADHPLGPG